MFSIPSLSISTTEKQNERSNELESILLNLPRIEEGAKDCLRNLAKFKAEPAEIEFPMKKLAGVLVLLHVNPIGELSLTLTTRSLTLRSHPGDTALPGGRFEIGVDNSVEDTALREANEEIGLPLSSSSLFYLTSLQAFTSRTLLVVIPVVYFLTDSTILSSLVPNPDEVDLIFHLPLKSFLGLDSIPRSTRNTNQSKVEAGKELLQHTFEDFVWLNEKKYRLHSFEHSNFPSVTGLTADILISTALIGYFGLSEKEEEDEVGIEAEGIKRLGFERRAEHQMRWKEIVKIALSLHGIKGLQDQRSSTS